jgi:hypothetical protein
MFGRDVRIRYQNTVDDLIACYADTVAVTPAARRAQRGIKWAVCVGALLLGIALSLREGGAHWAVSAVIFTGLFLALYRPLAPANVNRAGRRFANDPRNASRLRERSLEATPDALCWRTPLGEGRVYWQAFDRLQSTPTHLYLYGQRNLVFLVPRQRLLEGDADAFMATVAERVEASKPTSSPEA